MELKTISFEGHEIEFRNEYKESRNGFSHTSELFIDGEYAGKETVHYINRTWERYDFQCSMKQAVGISMGNEQARIMDKFKEERGLKRISKKYLEELDTVLKNDERFGFLKRLKESL